MNIEKLKSYIEVLRDPQPMRRRFAALLLRRYHFLPEATLATPALSLALDDSDPAVAKCAAEALALIGGATDDLVSRISSLKVLGLLGPPARSAIPRLIAALPDPAAIQALRLIGPGIEAVPALFKACENPDVQKLAVAALADVGRPAVGDALVRLHDSNGSVKHAAREVLERIAWVPGESARLLFESFKDHSLWRDGIIVRIFATDPREVAVGWVDAKEPVLEEAVGNSDPNVRRILVEALWEIDVDAAAGILGQIARDEDEDVRDRALRGAARKAPRAAVPFLIEACKQDSPQRATVIDYLSWTRTSDANFIFEEALDDPSPSLQLCAARTLAAMGATSPRVISILLKGLDSSEAVYCARYLANVGSAADRRLAVDKLVELLQMDTEGDHEREWTQRSFAAALCALAPDHPRLEAFQDVRILSFCNPQRADATRLLPGLASDNGWVRRCAAETLFDAGLETEAVTATLLEMVRSSSWLYESEEREIFNGASFEFLRTRWPFFVCSLMKLGVKCPISFLEDPRVEVNLNACRLLQHDDRVLPILVENLGRFFEPGVAAADLLAAMGERALPALPRVVELLNDSYNLFQQYAVRILGCIGPAAADAVPALIQSSEEGTADAIIRILPQFADLQHVVEIILSDPEYKTDLAGLTLNEVRLYLEALGKRRGLPEAAVL